MNPSRNTLLPAALLAMFSIFPVWAQTPAPRSVIGTVSSIRPDAGELDLKTPAGESRQVKWNPQTLFQRIAPGQKDLQSAQPVELSSIKAGDRLLVSLLPDGATARRVVVMAAEDISKKNQAEQEDWTRRGIAGVVTGKEGNVIKLRGGASVTVGEKTTVRRYAPDSVKFSEALAASAADIKPGDQMRARGDRPDPASALAAEEIVFGTFVTKAGTITEIRPEANELIIADLITKKPLTIKITADSEVKRLPARPGMGAGGPGGAGGGQGQGGGMRAGGPGGPGGGPMAGRPGGAPDPGRMFERLPPAQLADLQPGETLLVSSTKGNRDTEVTAIKLLSNVDMIIQMARAQAAAGAPRGQGRGEGAASDGPSLGGGMGMGGGMGGFDLGGLGGGPGGPQ